MFLTICISRYRRIGCFRPYVLPAGKNGTENAHLPGNQRNSEIFTNKPERKNIENAACGHPVSRILPSVARDINIARDRH